MPSTATVTLGDKLFPVVPQKHARIRHKLKGEDFQSLLSNALSGGYAVDAYRIICILIPAVDPTSRENRLSGESGLPFWQFDGFPTEEKWQAYQNGDMDAYDEEADPSPDTRQMVEAIQTALQVSGGDTLGKILGLVNTGAKVALAQGTPLSPASPGSTGGSPSTSSGTNPPTATPSEESPILDSES